MPVRGELSGRIVLLTGATGGLGRAAAFQLAAKGARLTIVGRDPEKCARTVASIKQATGHGDVHGLHADLSTMSGVRAVGNTFRTVNTRLDVLVNNAGSIFETWRTTEDGIETTFALNHLAYFGLTVGLLDLIRKSKAARVINTASVAYRWGQLDLTCMTRPRRHAGFKAYCDSKLANVLFTRALARRMAPHGGTANCFHPGPTRSGFGRGTGGILGHLMQDRFVRLFCRPPEQAADTLVWLASTPEVAVHNGLYFVDRKVRSLSRKACDDSLGEELWTASERLFARGAEGMPQDRPIMTEHDIV